MSDKIQCDECGNFVNEKCRFNLATDGDMDRAVFCATFSPIGSAKTPATKIDKLLERQDELLKPVQPTPEMLDLQRRVPHKPPETPTQPVQPKVPTPAIDTSLESMLYQLSVQRSELEEEIQKVKDQISERNHNIIVKCRDRIIASLRNPTAQILVEGMRENGEKVRGDFGAKEFRRLRNEGYVEMQEKEITIVKRKAVWWWTEKTLKEIATPDTGAKAEAPNADDPKTARIPRKKGPRWADSFDRLWWKIENSYRTNDFTTTDTGGDIRFQYPQLRILMREGILARPRKGFYEFTPQGIERIKQRLEPPKANPE